jgi:hypothetical protein
MKTRAERRTSPSTQDLDSAVLALLDESGQLKLQPILSMLPCCDLSHDQVEQSLQRLMASSAIVAGHRSTSHE